MSKSSFAFKSKNTNQIKKAKTTTTLLGVFKPLIESWNIYSSFKWRLLRSPIKINGVLFDWLVGWPKKTVLLVIHLLISRGRGDREDLVFGDDWIQSSCVISTTGRYLSTKIWVVVVIFRRKLSSNNNNDKMKRTEAKQRWWMVKAIYCINFVILQSW